MRPAWMLGLCCVLVPAEPPAAPAHPVIPAPRESVLPGIRSFDLETLARLGRDLYRHDQMAWRATDLVAEAIGLDRLRAEGGQGWVVDDSLAVPVVRFVRVRSGSLEAAWDVAFPLMGQPRVVTPADRSLTSRQAAQYQARTTAIRRLTEEGQGLCPVGEGSYNFVVLDDPAGKGLLFYLLRPKETMTSIPVGGHLRISLSEDGRSVTRVDRLSASCLTLERPAQKNAEALWMTHLTSPTPLETHVFLSLQENLPFLVSTPDQRLWRVSQGTITALESGAQPSGPAKP